MECKEMRGTDIHNDYLDELQATSRVRVSRFYSVPPGKLWDINT